ncbi:TPA: hypothetical protein ACH3X3_009285 [Trebouxia sp. C0006]
MLRVNSSNVLVVPPWECAWLSDEQLQLRDGAGCICFDVRGENDATVILKPTPGSKRTRYVRDLQAAAYLGNLHTDSNYTIILGSHRNSCLKFEKDLQPRHQADGVPGSKLTGDSFTRFWISYNQGTITVGLGEPGIDSPNYSWTDPDPIPNVKHVGLSTWDKHVGYRQIQMQPAVGRKPAVIQQRQEPTPQLGAQSLKWLCRQSIEQHLCPENLCSLLHGVEELAPALDELREPLMSCLADNLEEVVMLDHDGFCSLPSTCLADLLNRPGLACSEGSLFGACMIWVEESDSKIDEVEQLLPLIRFPLMTQQELQVVCAHPLASHSAQLQHLIAEAMAAQQGSQDLSPTSQVQMQMAPVCVESKRHIHAIDQGVQQVSQRFQRRHPSACQELMYMFDGDDNGVCHFIGTSYGSQEWVNPVLSGQIKVSASSPVCRNTDPKAVVSGNFLRMNFAGPCTVEGQAQTWWQVDLGEQHCLTCNYYTLRQDGSQDFVRNWVMQGSNDGKAWVTLRSHVNENTVKLPGQYASWPVTGHAALFPYHLFRLLLTGPNSGAHNNICLSYIEFYGYFLARERAVSP